MTAEIIAFPARRNAASSVAAGGGSVAFGSFRFWPVARRLEKGGCLVSLGGRALDILVALLERPGEVVSKQELMRRVWPGMAVEESNLRVNIASLRKALGDQTETRFIGSVPGRGYCFVAPVCAAPEAAPPPQADAATAFTLPAGLGVDQILQAIAAQLGAGQFVNIVLTNEQVVRVEGAKSG
jgi:DNA-binding winged helix-turn-helix (wHTH) protein